MKKINSNTAITKVAYALFLFSYMFDNVLFVQKYIGIIRMFAITLMFIKFFIVTKKYKKTTLLIMCLILALNVYVTYICKDPRILMLYLFIFSLKNVDIREFVKFDVKIKILFLLSVCILSGLNLTEVNNLNRGDEIVRYSLGFSHPNIFASYVLSISFELYYLLHNKHNIILSIILLISIFITYYISNTRSSSIIIAILLIFNMLERNKNNEKKYIKKARLAKSLFIFMFILSLTIGFLYDPSIKIYDNINQISSSRLYFMHEYLNRYNINLFGNNLIYISSFIATLKHIPAMILDNSYVYFILKFGFINTIIFCYFFLNMISKNKNNNNLITVISIYIIFGLFETGFLFLNTNIFLIYLSQSIFGDNKNKKGEKYECKKELYI